MELTARVFGAMCDSVGGLPGSTQTGRCTSAVEPHYEGKSVCLHVFRVSFPGKGHTTHGPVPHRVSVL